MNFADQDSHFWINGGTFLRDTLMTGFSSATAESSAIFDTITCNRGGDFFCDGVTKNSSSSCGLCP